MFMKKLVLFWGIGFLVLLIGLGAGYYFLFLPNTSSHQSTGEITHISSELEKKEARESQEIAQSALNATDTSQTPINPSLVNLGQSEKGERLSLLRKRFALRGTIAKGDDYIDSNQPILALSEYIKALKESPNDNEIVKKIAITYFELKKYESAVYNYEKVVNSLNPQERQSYIFSLLYTVDFENVSNLKSIVSKISKLPITREEKFYYINTIDCGVNFHECKSLFENYFANNTSPTFQPLKDVQNAILTYNNFQSEELYFKDTLLIGTFFQNKLYPVSNKIGESLLGEKPNYQPILLMVGKWYYELGNIKKSKFFLESYYNFNPDNTTVSFLLGNINYKLWDYISSNLYYNASLKNGFSGREDLQRKLAYNYYLLWDKRGMLNVFGYLVNEPKATMDDISLSIYWAIREKRTLNAIDRSKIGIKKFNNNTGHEIFYGYLGWVYREENNIDLAEAYINHGLKINPRNPLLLLNKGYLEAQKQNYIGALVNFKRTVSLNGDGEFWELASMEIKEVEKFIQPQNNTRSVSTGSILNH